MKAISYGFYKTPPLWKNQQFGIQQFDFPEWKGNSTTAVELPTNLRLGHQMEHVFKHLVNASGQFEVVLSNLHIEEGKLRVGELDFILRDIKRKQVLHVELAYKFYIINPEISEPIYRLMGPNRRDMFYTKLDKLKEKQLPLLYHGSLDPYWQATDINPLDIEQQCCIKAQLFQPYAEQASIRPLNMDCVAGSWIRFDDFNAPEFRKNEYYIPKKLEWVIAPHENVSWMNHYEALMDVNLRMFKENAPMLWVKQPSGQIEKLFVVWW
jgi:hypothetical protein